MLRGKWLELPLSLRGFLLLCAILGTENRPEKLHRIQMQ